MSTLRERIGVLLLPALTLVILLAAHSSQAQLHKRPVKNWINWNGVFKEGLDSVKRASIIKGMQAEIAALSAQPVDGVKAKKGKLTSYLRKQSKNANRDIRRIHIRTIVTKYCSCKDTLLWNVRADAIFEISGDSVNTTPKPVKPPVTPSGDPIVILEYNEEIRVGVDKNSPMPRTDLVRNIRRPATISPSAVIAVLDTGIDTTLMEEGMRSEILWKGPGGSKNMKFGADENNYMDDYKFKHGTCVANLAINSFYQSSERTVIPQLMVVKVLDSEATGHVFELCCGISYAVENKATVINASLGFYSQDDKVLSYYVAKCHRDSIPLVVAAGNAEEQATVDMVCSPNIRAENRITRDRLYLPAGLSAQPNSFTVFSVTGMREPGVPCFYQKYSNEFVTMGVVNSTAESKCCMYQLDFIDPSTALHGSSFATPIVSGRLAFDIGQLGHHGSTDAYFRMMNVQNAATVMGNSEVTRQNMYITY